ncbi:hypothetical protein ABT150_48155 [Streptomyces mirabilis]|uniref:hypothetical protein n=1 Tax=Streptomyces mirabilis TaxID=68239 RepID=UPI0033347A0E
MAEGRAMAVIGQGGREKEHAGQAYELSGPRLMSFADVVADIAYGTSRVIRYTPLNT